jgi:hypothetical protein
MAKHTSQPRRQAWLVSRRKWLLAGGATLAVLLVLGGWWVSTGATSGPTEAPEAQKVLDVQAGMPFQILIPAYLPREFDRANMDIRVNQSGPGGEPMVQLAYRASNGATLFVREWVPVNPDMEVLASSHPIETKWGRGWLLKQGEGLGAIWVDIGPLRASIYTPNLTLLPSEQLLAIAETMGPASNRQVFSFVAEPPKISEVPPPPPFEVPVNAEGVQEITLVVTPGGYSPMRFAVKKDVPVRLIFRQLGQVGCGNELIFPADPASPTSLLLRSASDKQQLEFTPRQAGAFEFHCSHQMYRGILTVRE